MNLEEELFQSRMQNDPAAQLWYEPMGLPKDPASFAPLGLESTSQAISAAPLITSIQNMWDDIKQDSLSGVRGVESAVTNIYGGIKDVTKTVYDDVSSGVGTVYDDVTKPVTTALTNTYWYLILGIVVIAGGLYFVGKGGAVKVLV